MFGAGGGTSSYREAEDADLIILWGSNARETHPIYFHHVLKGVRNGASLFVVDPRRTTSAQWADRWLGLDVGSDITLAHAVGREILDAGLENRGFIEHATSGLEAYQRLVEPFTLARAESVTGVPRGAIRDLAHAYAKAETAQLCWTLGITEHHRGADNVLALINLALLTGHVGRYGSGLCPLRGQNNVQGGGDMGALPDRLPGFQHVANDECRAKFEAAWGCAVPSRPGRHISAMFEAMGSGELTTLYVLGENPVASEPDTEHVLRLMRGLDFLVVQDLFMTQTAEIADVVLPAGAGWAESEGTVTSSERKVQRVRRVLDAPPGTRDDMAILFDLAKRLGHDWGEPDAEVLWDELRALSPMHAGMSYRRLEELGGVRWPCYDESHPGELFLHGRLWARPRIGPRAPFSAVDAVEPVDRLDATYPIRLTTGRRLDSYNTGVQSGHLESPLHDVETLDISPEDGRELGVREFEHVRVSSRRGSIVAPVRFDAGLRPGLAFMTLHTPDEVNTNQLTIEAIDPKSGVSEFKATAIRIDTMGAAPAGI